MIKLVSEAGTIFIATLWYWLNYGRRQYLKKRIGRKAYLNIFNVARNIHYMLFNKTITVDGYDRLPAGGSILYSFHFGVWELLPPALARSTGRLGIVVNRYQRGILNEMLDRFLVHYRTANANNVRIFSVRESREIIKFLQNGGTLGILVDGNELYSRFHTVQRLSRIARVPMIPFAAYRNNGSACLEIGCDLEKIITKRPMDYMWFYRSRNGI